MSIRENIAYGLENVSEERVIEAAKMANLHDFIDSLPEVSSFLFVQGIYELL